MKIDLSSLNGYTIASAIRGPDFRCSPLKFILTGPIRHMAGAPCNTRSCSLGSLNDVELTRWATEITHALNEKGIHHYLSHCQRALIVLGEYLNCNVGPLVWFAGLLIDMDPGDETDMTRINTIKDAIQVFADTEMESRWWESNDNPQRD